MVAAIHPALMAVLAVIVVWIAVVIEGASLGRRRARLPSAQRHRRKVLASLAEQPPARERTEHRARRPLPRYREPLYARMGALGAGTVIFTWVCASWGWLPAVVLLLAFGLLLWLF